MNKIAKILLTVDGVWAFGSGLFLPIFAVFAERVGGDILDAGIAAALFLLVTSTMQLPLGILVDRLKEKWFIAFGYFLTAPVFLGYAFVQNKWELFALQIILGVAIAVADVSWDSMYDRHTEDTITGRSWARYHSIVGYATALGIIIGSSIVHFYGFDAVFIIGSILAFTSGLMSLIFLPNMKSIQL
jgi:MFS family permease